MRALSNALHSFSDPRSSVFIRGKGFALGFSDLPLCSFVAFVVKGFVFSDQCYQC
jgi:hypothetical protein